MKKPRIAIVPCDNSPQNEKFLTQLQNSLRKFHTEEELPLIRYDLKEVDDPHKWYKATPLIARELIKDYDTVIKLDVDQIITGSLSDIWEGDFDAGVVLNDPSYPISVWDIHPYFNNGLVVLKSEDFINHWWRLCQSEHFLHYQFREQDILNILCSDYHNYEVRVLDDKKIYGEFAKPFWAMAKLQDNKLMVTIEDKEAEIAVIHYGGGDDPSKGNLKIRFKEDIVRWLDQLTKP